MDAVIAQFNQAGVHYILMGGQAMRLEGMPRFSMDWDFYIPPRDRANLDLINRLLHDELDLPLEPLGPRGENFVQTYQTTFGVLQFHLGGPGLPPYEEAERRAIWRKNEHQTPVRCLCGLDLLAAKEAANRPQDQLDIAFLKAKAAAGTLS